jgi:hypothetical protein
MALTARRRANLPARLVVYPKSSPVGGKGRNVYPIDTPKRARNALARAARSNTVGSYSTVARKVRAVYGDRIKSVGPTRGTTSRPGYAKTSSGRRRRG